MKNSQKKLNGDKEIGQRIRELRDMRKLSQKELAELVAVSQSVIARLERGESMVSVQTLRNIAKVLQMPVSVLLGEETVSLDTELAVLMRKLNQCRTEQRRALIKHFENSIDIIFLNK